MTVAVVELEQYLDIELEVLEFPTRYDSNSYPVEVGVVYMSSDM